jgi:hypothetical protein
MQFAKQKTCFLLLYLVLLLNLGPSLHHADFFGIHPPHHPTSADSTSVCCVHAHRHGPANDLNSAEVDERAYAGHDCSICKFFDQYHVLEVRFPRLPSHALVTANRCPQPTVPTAEASQPHARGPPDC